MSIWNSNCKAQDCFLGCCNKFGYCPSTTTKCMYYYSSGWNAGFESNVCDIVYNTNSTNSTALNTTALNSIQCPAIQSSINQVKTFVQWTHPVRIQQIAGGAMGVAVLIALIVTFVIWKKRQAAYEEWVKNKGRGDGVRERERITNGQSNMMREYVQYPESHQFNSSPDQVHNNHIYHQILTNQASYQRLQQSPSISQLPTQRSPIQEAQYSSENLKNIAVPKQKITKSKRQQFMEECQIPYWMMFPPAPEGYRLERDEEFVWGKQIKGGNKRTGKKGYRELEEEAISERSSEMISDYVQEQQKPQPKIQYREQKKEQEREQKKVQKVEQKISEIQQPLKGRKISFVIEEQQQQNQASDSNNEGNGFEFIQ